MRMALRLVTPWGLLVALAPLFSCTPSGLKNPQRSMVPHPGADVLPQNVLTAIAQKQKQRARGYQPRTKHLFPDGKPKYTNRLYLETSPYLLQHAHNPVNWYPWGDEAFEEAKKQGKPIFLSVGYSTCHWCHVMEEESFEDEEIAAYLNAQYIAVKVDREERPDVDDIYMQAVQVLTGRGGWPMSVWLTAEREPYYGGTYFPARDGDRGTRTGFLTILKKLKQEFDTSPKDVNTRAKSITSRIQASLGVTNTTPADPSPKHIHQAASAYLRVFDKENGGVRQRQKFPSSLPVRLLLRYHRRTGEKAPLEMATLTLKKMAWGGIHDHVGGGFHRYATDPKWLVPHFEKMLYDNALLLMTYIDAFVVTKDDLYANVARHILRYVARDMTSEQGAFYSATDADSQTPSGHMEEGWFFTWTPQEISDVVGADRANLVAQLYNVTATGNFEGRNIFHQSHPLQHVADSVSLDMQSISAVQQEVNDALYRHRQKRPKPLRDEKILTCWNGLMISAHAQAGLVFGEEQFTNRAARAARFILEEMQRDGRLLRIYKDQESKGTAFLDDYAFFIAGLLDLFEATGQPQWLTEAQRLDRILHEFYEDKKGGGFFLTPVNHEAMLVRQKPAYDGAEPSGNSVHAMNLLRLHTLTTDDTYLARAQTLFRAFHETLSRRPTSLAEMLLALDYYFDAPKEIVLVSPSSSSEMRSLISVVAATYLPNRALVMVTPDNQNEMSQRAPWVKGKSSLNGQPTAYVCENRICQRPTTDPAILAQELGMIRGLPTVEEASAAP